MFKMDTAREDGELISGLPGLDVWIPLTPHNSYFNLY